MNKRIFKIIISKEFKLQCLLIDSENKEEIIQIKENQNEYIPSILFDKTSIQICPNNTNLNIIKDLINEPDNYKYYSNEYQLNHYELIFEILFALIILEFKEIIQKNYIIENTIVQLPTHDNRVIRRIQISLETLNLPNIEINPITFDGYEEQGDKFYDILKRRTSYQNHLDMIENIKQFATNEQMEEINQKQEDLFLSQSFDIEIMKKFNFEQRSKMKLFKLDNYCLFIASRYLSSLADHINLTFVCRRMKGNMEKFHYNPISLIESTMSYFPTTETFHIYNKDDEYLNGGRITKYVDWVERDLSQMNEVRKMHSKKNIEFKNGIISKKNFSKEKIKEYRIPEVIKQLKDGCF